MAIPAFARSASVRTARGPGHAGGRGAGHAGRVGAAANPLLNPNVPLGPEARALANAAVNPTIAGLNQAIGQNNAQTQGALRDVGGYYTQLGDLAKQGFADEGKINSSLAAQLAGIGSQESSQLQGIGQQGLASLSKYTPQSDAAGSLRGSAGSALSSEIARQQGLAAQDQGAFRSFGANQGAAAGRLAASNLGTTALAGTEGLRNIADAGIVRNEPLEAKLASAIATRGADREAALATLQKNQAGSLIAEQGLGIRGLDARASMTRAQASLQNANTNVFKAKTTAQNDQAKLKLTQAYNQGRLSLAQAKNQLGWAQLSEKTRNDMANNALKQATLNAKKGGGSLTLGQQIGLQDTLERTVGMIALGRSKIGSSNGPKDMSQVVQDLPAALGSKFNGTLAQAAWSLYHYHAINQSLFNQLRQMGMRNITYKGRPVTVTPDYTPGQLQPGTQGLKGRGKYVP